MLRLPEGDLKQMKRKLLNLFARIGYARAASTLASMGKYKEAKELMMLQKEVE